MGTRQEEDAKDMAGDKVTRNNMDDLKDQKQQRDSFSSRCPPTLTMAHSPWDKWSGSETRGL